MNQILTLVLLTLYSCQLLAQAAPAPPVLHHLEPGQFAVGFQLFEDEDATRMVTAGTVPPRPRARPMRTWLWYPAKTDSEARAMEFGRYLELADGDIWPAEISGNLKQRLPYSNKVLARSLGPENLDALSRQPVHVVENAAALSGPFPLIVIGQGLYFESPIVFAALSEYLAGRGFVVATCPLAGTNSPFVRLSLPDLETPVRDLEFVIARARRLPFVSPDSLGVLGFDMGGMVGLILSMRNPDVDAFASISSGILYERDDGIPTDSPHFDPLALRAPWLHSVPGYWLPPEPAKPSLFDTAIHSDRYMLLTSSLGHADYTSYALIPGRAEMSGYWEASGSEIPPEHLAVNRYVHEFFAAYLQKNPSSLGFLEQKPEKVFPELAMTLEHRGGSPASITYEEFVQAVAAGNAEAAIEKVRALSATHPDHMLLQEHYLERLVWSLSNTWGLVEEVMPVVHFRMELYPDSEGAQRMLAEGYIDTENYPAAVEIYTRLKAQNPDDWFINHRLEWLQDR